MGGLRPLTVYCDNNNYYVVGIRPQGPSRGVWGHAPPENFGNLDFLRAFLRKFDTEPFCQGLI